MTGGNQYSILYQRFRRGECRVLIYVGAGVVSGLALAGLGLAVGWLFGIITGQSSRGNVEDEHIGIALAVALFLWAALQIRIWTWAPIRLGVRRVGAGVSLMKPIVLTVVITAVGAALVVPLSNMRLDDVEYIASAVCLLVAAGTMFVWLPLVDRLRYGRALFTPEDHIDVRCPNCAYSMIGLNETRCPECGATFTIDELIRAQNYEVHEPE